MAGLRVQVRSGGKSGARSAGVRVDGALGRAGAVAPGDGRPDATGPGKRLCASAAGAGQRGFSLIEIILVVVLIGGIVAFAATRILGGGDRARVRLAEAQVQTLAEKVQQFEMDTGSCGHAGTTGGRARRRGRLVSRMPCRPNCAIRGTRPSIGSWAAGVRHCQLWRDRKPAAPATRISATSDGERSGRRAVQLVRS